MTVQELIDELQKIEDKSAKVTIYEGCSSCYVTWEFEVEFDKWNNEVDLRAI